MKKTSIRPALALIRCTALAYFCKAWRTCFFSSSSFEFCSGTFCRCRGLSVDMKQTHAHFIIFTLPQNCPRDHFCLTIWNHNWSNAALPCGLMNNLSSNGRMITCFFLNNSLFSCSTGNTVEVIRRKPNTSELIEKGSGPEEALKEVSGGVGWWWLWFVRGDGGDRPQSAGIACPGPQRGE